MTKRKGGFKDKSELAKLREQALQSHGRALQFPVATVHKFTPKRGKRPQRQYEDQE